MPVPKCQLTLLLQLYTQSKLQRHDFLFLIVIGFFFQIYPHFSIIKDQN